MYESTTPQVPRPTDPSGDEISAIGATTNDDPDTEGHSMLTVEFANATHGERVRAGEKASRDRARVRDGQPGRDRGLLKRLGLR